MEGEWAVAWIVPNSQEATKKRLGYYLVSVDEVERQIGEKIQVADYAKHEKAKRSWPIPQGRDKG